MLRQRSSALWVATARRTFASTLPLRELQRAEERWTQHGGSGERTAAAAAAFFASMAPRPAADLERTPLQFGQGTDPRIDPHRRTLPNVELRSPISTVVLSDALPSGDIPRSALLSDWLGREGLLMKYLNTFRCDPGVQPPGADAVLASIAQSVLPTVAEADLSLLKRQWDALVAKFTSSAAVASQLFTTPTVFEASLRDLQAQVESFVDPAQHGETLKEASRVLRHKALLARDTELNVLRDFVAEQRAQEVWGDFCALVDQADNVVFEGATIDPRFAVSGAPVAALWKATRNRRRPQLTPFTALYFTAAVRALRPSPPHLDPLDVHGSDARRAAVNNNPSIDNPKALLESIKAFESLRLHNTAEAYVAMLRVHPREVAAAVASVAQLLVAHETAARQLLAALTSSNEALREKVTKLFGVPSNAGLHARDIFGSVASEVFKNWKRDGLGTATQLLADDAILPAVLQFVRSMCGNSQGKVESAVFNNTTVDKLEGISVLLRQQKSDRAKARAAVVAELLALPSEALVKTALARENVREHPTEHRPTAQAAAPNPRLIAATRAAMERSHPIWISQRVLSQPAPLTPSATLGELLRVYIRLTWIPQTARAALDSRHRQRPGTVGREPHHHNVCVEVGQAQHIDNLQYKQYDWQGWYQRMWDIHLRNSSVRLRVKDLRQQLCADGLPMLDLQGERRLRTVAGDRVGRGIIKLDADRFEDKNDNLEHGTIKLQQLLSEARKAFLGREYWPSVEVKVRRPSGQTKMRYSVLDWDRVEEASTKSYRQYVELKKSVLFVAPTETWLAPAATVPVLGPDDLFA